MFMSLGENCLVSYYLKLIGYSNEAYLFDSCRSNIEYITQIIINLDSIIDKDNLLIKIVEKKRTVTKNKKYSSYNNIFCEYHMDMFEFTHHNLIENKENYDSFIRKLERTKHKFNDDTRITFIYNHKYSLNNNIDTLMILLRAFIGIFQSIYRKFVNIIVIYQTIVTSGFSYVIKENIINKDSSIICINCYCETPWIGDNWNGESNKNDLLRIFTNIINKQI